MATIVRINDSLTIPALVGEYGFRAVLFGRSGQSSWFGQEAAHKEHQKLVAVIRHIGSPAHIIAYQWLSWVKNISLERKYVLLRPYG